MGSITSERLNALNEGGKLAEAASRDEGTGTYGQPTRIQRKVVTHPYNLPNDWDREDVALREISKTAIIRERLVKDAEREMLKQKVSRCYKTEGVNHLENCRELVAQYAEALKNPYKFGKPWPPPKELWPFDESTYPNHWIPDPSQTQIHPSQE
eukprot:TRINITY_DN1455_c0_g2_i1.p1 TRINITY_DN1455_c0_g2~~TRINITY_DN1455_c0_g2_i1.p1  ORF type:complete len:154 (-),score=28.41 TRINITY_DN1455_c0_g2_i1:163-624(-)